MRLANVENDVNEKTDAKDKDETEEKEEGEDEESDDEGDIEWWKELMQILVKRALRTKRRTRMF